MNNREKALWLLNTIDEEKMVFIVRILESLVSFAEAPNEKTLAAIREGDEMLASGAGKRYATPEALFADLES